MAKDNSVYVAKLKRLAQKWGGDILDIETYEDGLYQSSDIELSKRAPEFSSAPFWTGDLGVIHKDKLVLCEKYTPWPPLIHEMGHVFASKEPPLTSAEQDFLGWEYCVVKYIRAPIQEWYDSNSDYGLGKASDYPGLKTWAEELPSYIEMGSLNSRLRKIVMEQHIGDARELKLIDKRNRPLAIR